MVLIKTTVRRYLTCTRTICIFSLTYMFREANCKNEYHFLYLAYPNIRERKRERREVRYRRTVVLIRKSATNTFLNNISLFEHVNSIFLRNVCVFRYPSNSELLQPKQLFRISKANPIPRLGHQQRRQLCWTHHRLQNQG